MRKALISVSGADTTGIIARIATKLYEMNINILDISQTILSGCFTMMMVVDLTASGMTFTEVQAEGSKRMQTDEFLRGRKLTRGQRLG